MAFEEYKGSDGVKNQSTVSGDTVSDALETLDSAITAEDIWDRTGTTISPKVANDSVDIGAGIYTGAGMIGAYVKPASDSTAGIQLQKSDGTNILNVDTSNNRVGIGFNSPAELLHIRGLTDIGFRVQATAANSVAKAIISNDAKQWWLKVDGGSSDELAIRDNTGGVDRITIGNRIEMNATIGYTPSGDQSLAAGSTLTVTNGIMRVVGDGVGAVTLTSTPNIAAGFDGQVVIIQGTSDTFTVEFQDEGNLASSGLKLHGGNNAILGKGDILMVTYDAGDSLWYEVSRSDN